MMLRKIPYFRLNNHAAGMLRICIVGGFALAMLCCNPLRAAEESDIHQKFAAIRWVAYSSPTGNPIKGIDPKPEEMKRDLVLLRRAGFTGLVTYTANGAYGKPLVAIAEELGFRGLVIGVWDPKSKSELAAAASVKDSDIVLCYCVGNEGLDQRYSIDELSAAMKLLAESSGGKTVITSEESGDYLFDDHMFKLGDVFCNAHPYFANRLSAKSAVDWTVATYRDLEKAAQRNGRRVLALKEVGMPTFGDTGGKLSEEIQDEYYKLLETENLRFVYFESFDLTWKDHLPVEPHWGLFRSDLTPKKLGQHLLARYQDHFDRETKSAASRENERAKQKDGAGKIPHLESDGSFAIDQYYVASGFTGDIDDIKSKLSKEESMRFEYTPRGLGQHEWEWKFIDGQPNPLPARSGGVLLLSPPNDFGGSPECGFDLRGVQPNIVRFEARRTGPPVNVRFSLGGVVWKWEGGEKKAVSYPDSVPHTHLGIHALNEAWTTYELRLPPNLDFSRLVGGFAWTITWTDNGIHTSTPNPTTFSFELRGIRLESQTDLPRFPDNRLDVYTDADSSLNRFLATGFMGDVGDVRIDELETKNPAKGKTCMRVEYLAKGAAPHACDYPGPCRWAGLYWQHPISNFGQFPFFKGLDLSGYKKLTFSARAPVDTRVEFMVAGIDNPHGDSQSTAVKEAFDLTPQWQEFEIPLMGDFSHTIGGFGFVSNFERHPQGAVFFLDEIRFEK